MHYKSIVVPERGSSDVFQIAENELRLPASGEARICILVTPVCQDDVAVRVGNRPFTVKPPFVPGYSILGEVDAIGGGVTQVAVGDRVAALTSLGGYAEYIYLDQDKLVQVPMSLDPAEAAVLILNYLVAYQTLHRVAKVKTGDKILIIGASGGVGTAYLQLGQQAQLSMYGLASPSKHAILTEYGALPIDYHTQDFVEVILSAEPDGIDYVFNGMGEEYLKRSMQVLRRGGAVVHYGAPQSFSHFLVFMAEYLWFNLMPNGKSLEGYGTHRLGVELFKQDWAALFQMLDTGEIKPIIAGKFPLLEAARANDLLESGAITGNLVLLAPELLSS